MGHAFKTPFWRLCSLKGNRIGLLLHGWPFPFVREMLNLIMPCDSSWDASEWCCRKITLQMWYCNFSCPFLIPNKPSSVVRAILKQHGAVGACQQPAVVQGVAWCWSEQWGRCVGVPSVPLLAAAVARCPGCPGAGRAAGPRAAPQGLGRFLAPFCGCSRTWLFQALLAFSQQRFISLQVLWQSPRTGAAAHSHSLGSQGGSCCLQPSCSHTEPLHQAAGSRGAQPCHCSPKCGWSSPSHALLGGR